MNHAILHDDGEVFVRVGDEVEIFEGVAIDQQQVGIGTFPDHPELARVRAPAGVIPHYLKRAGNLPWE